MASSPAVDGLVVSSSSGPRLTERGTCMGIYTQRRTSFLIGYYDDVVKRHHVEFGLFGVASGSGYVFYRNSDCVLLLFVSIRLDRKYYLYFYLNFWHNCFYKVLVRSLPSDDLLLQTEYKGTIVQLILQCPLKRKASSRRIVRASSF